MRRSTHAIGLMITAPILLAGAALGGEGVQVKITNDGTKDVVVTVYDNNVKPQKVVLENVHISGFSSMPINVVGDASGQGNISWSATSSDGVTTRCGHAETHVSNDGSVRVTADDSCAGLSAG